jgi:adenylate cyclase
MRNAIDELNNHRIKEGKTPLAIHVGINTGEALVGDLGTEWRHAYTVLGDAVNVAQRLMVLAGQLGTDIVVGQEAALGANNLISIGEAHLPGREHLESVFVIPVTQ